MSARRRRSRPRRLAWLGLAFVLASLAYAAGKYATCRYLPCGVTTLCPPCPGDPPPDGTAAPVLVKPAATPMEPTP